jgi:hypothetical protein
MTSVLRTAMLAAGLSAIAGPAFACPNGYKAVWIQGHKICQIDASASNKLKAAGGGVGAAQHAAAKRVR